MYGWFVGMEDNGERLPSKITDAKDLRRLPGLMDDPVAFKRFREDPKLSLADAARGIAGPVEHVDWRGILHSNVNTLEQIPAMDLPDAQEADVDLLEKVKGLAEALIRQIHLAQEA